MKNIKYSVLKLLLLLFLCCTTLSAIEKNNPENSIDYYYSGIQKIFLHLNKDVYITGENVLFKGYLVNAANKPDTLCKIIYIELLNSANQKISKFSVNVFNGVCNSYFVLPDTLATGYYYVKAFTNQMRNFDNDYYFSTKIIIANQADEQLEKLITDNYVNTDSSKILFYTQNDNLIYGLENSILFKITNFPIEIDKQPVEIINDSGKIVISVMPNNKGVGNFTIIPEKNKKYYVQWNNKKFELPTTSLVNGGFFIQVEQSEEKNIKITVNSNNHELSDILKIKAFNNGKDIFEKEFTISNGSVSFIMPLENVHNGCTILTLFNSSMQLLCNKTIYTHNNNPDIININSNKTSYQPREKVIITFDLKNKKLLKEGMDLSVNISQKGIPGMAKSSSIEKYFELQSYLGQKNSELLDSETDSIPMIQANNVLTSFKLPKLFSNRFCQFLPENKGYILSGTVLSKNNIPVPNICVTLAVADSFANFKYCYSDTFGKFFFRLSRFYDNKNLILQAKNSNNEPITIEIEDKFNGLTIKHVGSEYISNDLRKYLKSLQTISLTNKIFKPKLLSLLADNKTNDTIYNYNFYGSPNVTLFPSDYDELENLRDIVRNILPGVYYNTSEKKIRIIDYETHNLWPNEALVFLNNVPNPDPAFIANLGSKQIRKIDLKKNHIIYGDIDIYGILSITTIQKNVYALNPEFANISFQNIVQNIPVAINGSDIISNNILKNIPDLRQTLYWNPELKIAENGTATIELYTSDLKGDYTIEVEGISKNGTIIHSNSTIEVK